MPPFDIRVKAAVGLGDLHSSLSPGVANLRDVLAQKRYRGFELAA